MSFITKLFQDEIMIDCFVQPFLGPEVQRRTLCGGGGFGRSGMQREEGVLSVFGSVLKVFVSQLL